MFSEQCSALLPEYLAEGGPKNMKYLFLAALLPMATVAKADDVTFAAQQMAYGAVRTAMEIQNGIAGAAPITEVTVTAVIERADKAMYCWGLVPVGDEIDFKFVVSEISCRYLPTADVGQSGVAIQIIEFGDIAS